MANLGNLYPDDFRPSPDTWWYQLVDAFALEDQRGRYILPGFEDVIAANLGEGSLFNTQGTVFQLLASLAHSNHPTVDEIKKEQPVNNRQDILARITRIREDQVLEGMRILDLGCGEWPTFALAATALGAIVHTADASEIPVQYPDIKGVHTSVDLCGEEATEALKATTGGKLDVVTESMVLAIPEQQYQIAEPDFETFVGIGRELLRPGGVLVLPTLIHAGSPKVYERI